MARYNLYRPPKIDVICVCFIIASWTNIDVEMIIEDIKIFPRNESVTSLFIFSPIFLSEAGTSALKSGS